MTVPCVSTHCSFHCGMEWDCYVYIEHKDMQIPRGGIFFETWSCVTKAGLELAV